MESVNGTAPVLKTTQVASNKFRSEFELTNVGIDFVSEDKDAACAARVDVMIQGLTTADELLGYRPYDLTYGMLLAMDSRINGINQEIQFIKNHGSNVKAAANSCIVVVNQLVEKVEKARQASAANYIITGSFSSLLTNLTSAQQRMILAFEMLSDYTVSTKTSPLRLARVIV